MTEFVFVHAIGRPGADAWLGQADLPRARFLTRRGFDGGPVPSKFTIDGEGRWIADHTDQSCVVVGHSWSAVAVLASLFDDRSRAEAAVLIEPIATFAAPGEPLVRQHVEDMAPAFVPGLSLKQFRQRFSTGVGFELPPPDSEAATKSLELLRRHRPPWETRLTARNLQELRVPVAVVTGGEHPLYEVIANAMGHAQCITHHTIPGGGHRPQDTPRFNQWLTSWAGPTTP